jgi:hypothetical protein
VGDDSGSQRFGAVISQLPDDDGSGSDEFELTPGLGFPLLAGNEDVVETTTEQFSSGKTTISAGFNLVQSKFIRPPCG